MSMTPVEIFAHNRNHHNNNNGESNHCKHEAVNVTVAQLHKEPIKKPNHTKIVKIDIFHIIKTRKMRSKSFETRGKWRPRETRTFSEFHRVFRVSRRPIWTIFGGKRDSMFINL